MKIIQFIFYVENVQVNPYDRLSNQIMSAI
jgi:hypothetical protein